MYPDTMRKGKSLRVNNKKLCNKKTQELLGYITDFNCWI